MKRDKSLAESDRVESALSEEESGVSGVAAEVYADAVGETKEEYADGSRKELLSE